METPPDIDEHAIDITRSADLVFWAGRLKATEEQIKEAVRAVGPQVEGVKRCLDETAEAKEAQPVMLASGFGTIVG